MIATISWLCFTDNSDKCVHVEFEWDKMLRSVSGGDFSRT